jgi:hypothetical protein
LCYGKSEHTVEEGSWSYAWNTLWNVWNMFLDEYGAKISIKKVVFRDFSDHNLGYEKSDCAIG